MAKTKLYNHFKYKIINIDKEKCVQIVAFDNSVSSPIVPAYIDDLPVRSISSFAFAGSPIETIQLPDTLVRIMHNAFRCCYNLKNISFPDSVKIIGESVCSGCANLRTVKWSKSNTTINPCVFHGCGNLREITNIDSVEVISDHAFFESGLESFEIPRKLVSISFCAFANCERLKQIKMTHLPILIEKSAFENSKNIEINCGNVRCVREWAQQTGLPIKKSKINTFLNMELENKEKEGER